MFWNLIARFLALPAVTDWLIRRAMRTPYTHIDGYMNRYWLFNPYPPKSSGKRPWWQFPISIRLHHILREDDDRHHHDHPWNARTVILRGGYSEYRNVVNDGALCPALIARIFGDTAQLRFGEFHRIAYVSPGGVWTLFVTGRYQGKWGFDVDGVKVPYNVYLAKDRRNCEECDGSGEICVGEYPGSYDCPPEPDIQRCEGCAGTGKTL